MNEQDKRSGARLTREEVERAIRLARGESIEDTAVTGLRGGEINGISRRIEELNERQSTAKSRIEQLAEKLDALSSRSDQISDDLSTLREKIESGLEKVSDSGQVVRIDYSVGNEDAMLMDYLRTSVVVKERPDVSFNDVGGQDFAVNKMKELALKLQHIEIYRRWGVKPPRGILLYGLPGTGKTLLARALAHELSAGFVSANPSNLMSFWYGQSEKLTAFLFKVAQEEAVSHGGNCILFLDEVEAIARDRSNVQWAIDNRVFSILLQEIDGFAEHRDSNVIVVAATNRRDMVDPAFLSRMSESIEMPLPDSQGIIKILDIHFKLAARFADRSLVIPQVNFKTTANLLKGYSGRDISDFVQMILEKKVLDELRKGGGIPLVDESYLLNTLSMFKRAKPFDTKR